MKSVNFNDSVKLFLACGTDNHNNLDMLKDHLVQGTFGKGSRSSIQRQLASILQKARLFVEAQDPITGVENCVHLMQLFSYTYESLDNFNLVDEKDLPFGRLTILQLAFHFVKVCIIKISDRASKSIEIATLTESLATIALVLQKDLRTAVSNSETHDINNFLNICQSIYAHFYNYFALKFHEMDESLSEDVFQLALLAFPFKSFKKDNSAEKNALWSDRLADLISQVIQNSKAITLLTLSEQIIDTLKRCTNVSMGDVVIIFSRIVALKARESKITTNQEIFDDILWIWNNFLCSSDTFQPIADQLLVLMKAFAALELFGWKSHLVSRAVRELMKQNQESRRVVMAEKQDAVRTKLNFDGEIEEHPVAAGIATESLSQEDEKALVSSIIKVVESFSTVFLSQPNSCPYETYSDTLQEMLQTLLACCQILQLHRMHYYAVKSSQLAWKMVTSLERAPARLLFAVAAAYIHSLCAVRFYGAAASVVEDISQRGLKDDSKCYASFLVAVSWLNLFTYQENKLNQNLANLDNIMGVASLEDGWQRIMMAQCCRLKAYACINKMYVNSDLENCTQTPLYLLEKARNEIVAAASTQNSDYFSRRMVGMLYMTLCADLAQVLLSIGAPVEARPFAHQGLLMAKKTGSRRWTMMFGVFEAHCYFSQSKLEEFRFTLCEIDVLLAARSPSVLLSLDKYLAKRSEKCKAESAIDDVASEMENISLDDQHSGVPESNCLDGFRGNVLPEFGRCKIKKTGKEKKICECEECRDFDVQRWQLECAYLKYISNNNSEEKKAIFQKCCEIFNEKLQYTPRIMYELCREGTIKISKSSCLPTMSLVETPMLKLRLRSLAANFQAFRCPLGKDIEDREKFEKSFTGIIQAVKESGDLAILNPEITALSAYLEILCLLVKETKSVSGLQNLLRSIWGFDHLAKEIENHDFRGIAGGKVIPDNLTSFFGKSVRTNAGPVKLEKPVLIPSTPLKDEKLRKDLIAELFVEQREGRQRVRRNAIIPLEEPEMPSDMVNEIMNQPKLLAKRRMTVLCEQVQPLEEGNSQNPIESCAPNRKETNGALDEMLEKLRCFIKDMEQFPLFPYYRNANSILTLLSGITEDSETLAQISSAGTSAKLHHLALLSSIRMLSQISAAESECLKSQIGHLAFTANSRKLLTENLPEDWVVCSISLTTQSAITLNPTSEPKILTIGITRWEKGAEPITLLVPVSDGLASNALGTLLEIHKEADKNQKNYKDAKDYWRKRLWLNTEVAELATSLEQMVGYMKALFLSFPTDKSEIKIMKEKIKSLKTKAAQHGVLVPPNILRLLALAAVVLPKDSHSSLTSRLLKLPKNAPVVESFVEIACKNKSVDSACYQRTPLILILDNESHQLPWESIPTLRNHPVSRLPSIKFLNLHLEKYREHFLKRDRGFFILNPDADLKKMQTTFEDLFNRLRKSHWVGVAGSAPSSEQVVAAFKERDFILYMGHGSGAHIFNLSTFDTPCTKASMFLVGCSSVQLRFSVWMDATGFLEQCVTMGSPCIMGNLWTVTSGCIDALISTVLEDLMAKNEKGSRERSFLELLAMSRDRIKSNYLVGAAPVIIGLPASY